MWSDVLYGENAEELQDVLSGYRGQRKDVCRHSPVSRARAYSACSSNVSLLSLARPDPNRYFNIYSPAPADPIWPD